MRYPICWLGKSVGLLKFRTLDWQGSPAPAAPTSRQRRGKEKPLTGANRENGGASRGPAHRLIRMILESAVETTNFTNFTDFQ